MSVKPRKHSYDSACESLAEHFLAGENPQPGDLEDLAQDLQEAVESWFADRKLKADSAP